MCCPLHTRASAIYEAMRASPGKLSGTMTNRQITSALGLEFIPGDSIAIWVALQDAGMHHLVVRKGKRFIFKTGENSPA